MTFPNSDIKLRNGKLHFTASVDEFPRVHGLRSIDNLYCTIADVKFKWDIIPEGVPAHTPPLRRIAEDINWPSVAQLWSRNQPFVRRGNKKTWNKKSTVNGESTNKGRSFRSRTFGVFQEFEFKLKASSYEKCFYDLRMYIRYAVWYCNYLCLHLSAFN